ncbi:MAG TPA: hypothetical protein VKY31_12985 [Terriglobia bacterium]|nr:hypothetical protein [Terriglobia bacterium]
MTLRLLLALFLMALTCSGQGSGGYAQRGFLETQGTIYPEKAPNDSARAVAESLLRYEGIFRASNSLQFAGGLDFRIDTHRQVEREGSLSWWDRQTQRPSGEVRRLSATYHRGPMTFEAGKQFVRWGKTDIVTPTDRFAPRDFLTVVDNEFLGITATRLNIEKGSNTIEAVWSPRLTPSRIPLFNQRWSPIPELPAGVSLGQTTVNFPGGSQEGIRWNHTGPVEYELSLYEGFNHLPSFQGQSRLTPEGIAVDVERFYPKMLMGGGDIAVPMRLFTVKAEAAHFSSTDPRTDEYGLYVLQLERQAGEWYFVGGYAGEVVTSHGQNASTFAPDRGLTKTFLSRAGYTIDTNRSIAFETAVRQNGQGVWVKNEYSQSFGQHWRTTVNLTVIRGDMGDFLGQYRRNSHAVLVVRYSF